MKDRLKNTILSSLLFSKGWIRVFLIVEILMALAMAGLEWSVKKEIFSCELFFGNDFLIIVLLFLFGLSFFDMHNGFCVSNAVSRKYQLVSLLTVSGGLCVILAVLDSVIRELIISTADFSIAQVLRLSISGGFFLDANIFVTILEACAMYLMVFYVGYSIAAIKEARGAKTTLIVMFLVAWILVAGIAIGYFTWINPIAWVFGFIPAFAMGNAFLSTVFYLLVAVGGFMVAYRFDYAVKAPNVKEV